MAIPIYATIPAYYTGLFQTIGKNPKINTQVTVLIRTENRFLVLYYAYEE